MHCVILTFVPAQDKVALRHTYIVLGMCCATPSVNLDLEKTYVNMIEESKKNIAVGKRAIPQVILNDKECYCITMMHFQLTMNKTRKYLATVQCLLSPLEIVCQGQS